MQIPAQYLAAVAEFQATKDTRYMLNGICIKQKVEHVEICATNGHILLKIDHPTADSEIWERIVKLPDALLKALRLKKSFDKRASFNFTEETVLFDGVVYPFEVVDGTYPDYDRIIPNGIEPNGSPAFNADYMATFAKAGRYLAPKQKHNAIQWINNDMSAAKVLFPLIEADVVGVAMPVRV